MWHPRASITGDAAPLTSSARIDALVADLAGRGSVLVAYSGGVDSGRGGGARPPGAGGAGAGGDRGGRDAGRGGARPRPAARGRDRHPPRGGHLQRAGRSRVRRQSQPPLLRLPGDADGHHAPAGGRARLRRGLRRHQRLRSRAGPAGARGRCASAASTRRSSPTGSTRRRPGRSPARSASRSGTGRPTPASPRASRTASSSPSASCAASRPPRRSWRRAGFRVVRVRHDEGGRAGRGRPRRGAAPRRALGRRRAPPALPRASSASPTTPAATAAAAADLASLRRLAVNPRAAPRAPRGGGRRRPVSPRRPWPTSPSCPTRTSGFAKLDLHRELRNGLPEAVYAEGKRPTTWRRSSTALLAAHGRRAGDPPARRSAAEACWPATPAPSTTSGPGS